MSESLFNGAKFILIDEAYYIYSMPSTPSGRSPHSRTIQDFSRLTRQSDMMSEKYGDRIDAKLTERWKNFGRP